MRLRIVGMTQGPHLFKNTHVCYCHFDFALPWGGGPERRHTISNLRTRQMQFKKGNDTGQVVSWYLQVSRGGTFPCATTLLSPSLKLLPRLDLSITGTVFDHHLFSRGFHRHSSECQLMTGMLNVPFWRCYELMAGQNQTAWCLLAN